MSRGSGNTDIAKKAGRALLFSSLAVLVPARSWGLDDARGFFREPCRATYTLFHGLVYALVGYLIDNPFRGGLQETEVHSQTWVSILGYSLTMMIGIYGPYADRRGIGVMRERRWVRCLGLALGVFGGLLVSAALWILRDQYSFWIVVQEDHRIIEEGLYRRIRHPEYLGLMFTMIGFALVFRSRHILYLFPAAFLTLVTRAGAEERLMESTFGEEWRDYCRRTQKFVPGLY